jgi:pectate disaccharide-lyase
MRFRCLLFTVISFSLYFTAFSQTSEVSAPAQKWQSIAFGQSVDLNFSSTIAPDKIGINGAIPENPGTINGKIIIESRGGKIAKAHDGLAFYYTVIDPTKYNFILEADILVEQFGPGSQAAPNNQTACGLMVRDVNGAPRKDPMVFGYEELPAASNFAATAVFSSEKTVVNANAVTRNGIFHPWGNSGSTFKLEPFKKGISIAKPFKLKLERTDTGFIMSYADTDGKNEITKTMTEAADIVQVCEKDKMYVGFFAARNAKMVVSNAKLTVSPSHTKPGIKYTPAPLEHFFEIESSDGSATETYSLVVRSGYNGSVSISKDGKIIAARKTIKAGEFSSFKTKLTSPKTKFDITFIPSEGPKSDPIIKTITVEKRSLNGKTVYASQDGKPEVAGTLQNPVNVSTAIKFVQPGGTIYLRSGVYDAITISRLYSGVSKKVKTIMPYKNEKVTVKGLFSQASFWHIYGIESADSKSYGFRIEGSFNTIELCTAHDNKDTGFHMNSVSKIPALKAGNNVYLNCESYNSTDPTMENADGFAAKNNVGKGNIYRGCISHHNADDGWDFFNNLQDGPNESITLENCIAYQNGVTTHGESAGGAIGNGFKIGGEGQPVSHILKNCIAYQNKMDGITCNFNPGSLIIENCTSFDNARCNYIFRSNPYITPSGTFINNLSFRTDTIKLFDDFVAGKIIENNMFFKGSNEGVKESDFRSLKAPTSYSRNKKGEILFGEFLQLSDSSPLRKAGKNQKYIGAIPSYK